MEMIRYNGALLLVSAVAFLPPAITLALFSQVSPVAVKVLDVLLDLPHAVGYAACAAMAAIMFFTWYKGWSGEPAVWLMLMLPVGASAVLCFEAFPCLVPALLTMGTAVWFGIAKAYLKPHCLKFWFGMVCTTLLVASVCCFLIWSVWLKCRLPKLSKWTDWEEDFQDRVRNSQIPWKLAEVEWLVPLGMSAELFAMAMLCWLQQSQLKPNKGDNRRTESGVLLAEQAYLVSKVKLISLVVCVAMMVLWIGASLDATGNEDLGHERADMRNDIIGLAFWFFAGLGAWLTHNLGAENLMEAARTSKVAERVLEMAQSEWALASYLFCFAPFLLIRKILKGCYDGGTSEVPRPSLEEQRSILEDLALFRPQAMYHIWTTSVLTKAQLLGIGYVSFAVGVKATMLGLAYTNELLEGIDVMWVSLAIYLVGTFLFLLPPTPGPPVYALVGIVVTASARSSGWSAQLSLCLAIAVGFSIKMAFAAIAQKFIGEPLATSTQVRSLVQVHTTEIRAIEMILKEQGITAAKVAILIGGPDWPVAVLCGILRLPLCQIMVALSPVLLQSVVPCVLSGWVLVMFGDDEKKAALGETAVAVAGGLQIVALMVAGYYIQEAIELHYDELQVDREEDRDVRMLEEEDAKRARDFKLSTAWNILPRPVQGLLVCSLISIYMSCVLLAGPWRTFLGVSCFKKFEITSSIDQTLDGNALAIVQPLGWIAIGLCLPSVVFLWIFNRWASGRSTAEGRASHNPISPTTRNLEKESLLPACGL